MLLAFDPEADELCIFLRISTFNIYIRKYIFTALLKIPSQPVKKKKKKNLEDPSNVRCLNIVDWYHFYSAQLSGSLPEHAASCFSISEAVMQYWSSRIQAKHRIFRSWGFSVNQFVGFERKLWAYVISMIVSSRKIFISVSNAVAQASCCFEGSFVQRRLRCYSGWALVGLLYSQRRRCAPQVKTPPFNMIQWPDGLWICVRCCPRSMGEKMWYVSFS